MSETIKHHSNAPIEPTSSTQLETSAPKITTSAGLVRFINQARTFCNDFLNPSVTASRQPTDALGILVALDPVADWLRQTEGIITTSLPSNPNHKLQKTLDRFSENSSAIHGRIDGILALSRSIVDEEIKSLPPTQIGLRALVKMKVRTYLEDFRLHLMPDYHQIDPNPSQFFFNVGLSALTASAAGAGIIEQLNHSPDSTELDSTNVIYHTSSIDLKQAATVLFNQASSLGIDTNSFPQEIKLLLGLDQGGGQDEPTASIIPITDKEHLHQDGGGTPEATAEPKLSSIQVRSGLELNQPVEVQPPSDGKLIFNAKLELNGETLFLTDLPGQAIDNRWVASSQLSNLKGAESLTDITELLTTNHYLVSKNDLGQDILISFQEQVLNGNDVFIQLLRFLQERVNNGTYPPEVLDSLSVVSNDNQNFIGFVKKDLYSSDLRKNDVIIVSNDETGSNFLRLPINLILRAVNQISSSQEEVSFVVNNSTDILFITQGDSITSGILIKPLNQALRDNTLDPNSLDQFMFGIDPSLQLTSDTTLTSNPDGTWTTSDGRILEFKEGKLQLKSEAPVAINQNELLNAQGNYNGTPWTEPNAIQLNSQIIDQSYSLIIDGIEHPKIFDQYSDTDVSITTISDVIESVSPNEAFFAGVLGTRMLSNLNIVNPTTNEVFSLSQINSVQVIDIMVIAKIHNRNIKIIMSIPATEMYAEPFGNQMSTYHPTQDVLTWIQVAENVAPEFRRSSSNLPNLISFLTGRMKTGDSPTKTLVLDTIYINETKYRNQIQSLIDGTSPDTVYVGLVTDIKFTDR